MKRLLVPAFVAASLAAGDGALDATARERLLRLGPMPALPADPTNRWADDPAAAALGRELFGEPRLSRNGEVSCASCHQPERGFADGRKLAMGLSMGTRHSQSLLDAAHQRWFTWDGRADSLWSQALHPFQNPLEMGLTPAEVIERVRSIEPLRVRYEAVFGALPAAGDATAIDAAFARLGKAIAAFERTLVTGPSAFDRWLDRVRAGDDSPTPEFGESARRGAELFVGKADCVRCHSGPLLSDGEFHMIGVPSLDGAAPVDRGRLEGVERLKADRFNASGMHSDAPDGARAKVTRATTLDPEAWGRFRTPSLRSAALTPPYMHQGQLATLEEVVRFYDTLEGATTLDHHAERVLEPLGLSEQQRADLVAFLKAVQGAPPADTSATGAAGAAPGAKSVEKPGVGGSQSP